MLDEQHGDALAGELADLLEQRLAQGRVHAGHRLVEHEQPRSGHDRTGQLQQLPLSTGEGAGEVLSLGPQADPLDEFRCAFAVRRLLGLPPPRHQGRGETLTPLVLRAQTDVVQHGQAGEDPGRLEGADHAALGDRVGGFSGDVLPLEPPAAAVGLLEPGEQVEEGGLAGTVRADESDDATGVDRELGHGHGPHTAEGAVHVLRDQDRVADVDVPGHDDPRRRGCGRGAAVSAHRSTPPPCCPGFPEDGTPGGARSQVRPARTAPLRCRSRR